MKKTSKKAKKPFAPLYYCAFLLVSTYYRLRWHVKTDRTALKDLKGPAIVLAPHISDKDHFLVGMELFPHRPTFVLSEHFMGYPLLRPVLKVMRVITKRMFCADVGTIMKIMRALKSGNVVVLFPEGRLTWYGHSLTVTEGTAELVKKAGADVYTVTGNGAYLTFPKWRKKPRRGKISVTADHLFTPEDIKALSVGEIRKRIDNAIFHDDEQAMEDTEYRCSDMTNGLDGILYKCPECGSEFRLRTGGNRIVCESCGESWTLDGRYILHGKHFTRINEWCMWQISQLDPQYDRLECDVRVGAVNDKGNIDHYAGTGHAALCRDMFTFSGTVFGKEISFEKTPESIGGFPITVASAFDIYHENRLLYMHPLPDLRTAVKWVTLLDRIIEDKKKNEN